MEQRNRYRLMIDSDITEQVRDEIFGVITNCCRSSFNGAITMTYGRRGWWIFKQKKVTDVTFEFNATENEANCVFHSITYLYGKDERRDFGYGIQLIKAEV